MRQKHIVVIGWDVDQTVEGLLQGLGDFAPAGSSVTIISPEKPDDVPGESGACTFQHLEGSIASRQVLMEVNNAHLWRRESVLAVLFPVQAKLVKFERMFSDFWKVCSDPQLQKHYHRLHKLHAFMRYDVLHCVCVFLCLTG